MAQIFTQAQIDLLNQEIGAESNEDFLHDYALFQVIAAEMIDSPFSFVSASVADYLLTNFLKPELIKRGLKISDVQAYNDIALSEIQSGNASIKAKILQETYLAIRDARLAKNKKIWMWVIIVAIILVLGWAYWKYHK